MEYDYLLDTYDLSSDSDSNNRSSKSKESVTNGTNAAADLGIDQEVIVKKRKPLAKLDEKRLLTANGLPALKSKIAPRIKFKGKGYERRDLTKLLSTYQIWAHGLFPKANFMDFVHLAKRAGSTPVMKVYRRQWIDEEKRKSTSDALDEMYGTSRGDRENEVIDNPVDVNEVPSHSSDHAPAPINAGDSLFLSDDEFSGVGLASNFNADPSFPPDEDTPQEDDLNELDEIWSSVHRSESKSASQLTSQPLSQSKQTLNDVADHDGDDADISDSEIIAFSKLLPNESKTENKSFEDEEFELMAEMGF